MLRVGLAFMDREYRVLRINERLAAVSGLSAEQAIGRNIRRPGAESAAQLVEIWRAIFERGQPYSTSKFTEPSLRRPANNIGCAAIIPLQSEAGEITGVIASVLDITLAQARRRKPCKLRRSITG